MFMLPLRRLLRPAPESVASREGSSTMVPSSFSRITVVLFLSCGLSVAQSPNRVTILYDAFGKSPNLTKDWGFSALVEYGGKRILFDTGNNAGIFASNVKSLKV